MTEEMKELQKEINGKVVIRIDKEWPDVYFDAILIWPPEGKQVSVKAYGIEPEEVYMLQNYNTSKGEFKSIEELEDPKHCFAAFKIVRDNLQDLRNIAAIKDGGIFDFNEVHISRYSGDSPSCPYG